tara:strand:- start:82 stop:537 length:456 start_codon:yes stop_codon:yes gene_type:complete
MNELIVNKDGTVSVVGDGGSVNRILDDLVKANTTPAVYNDDGSVKTAAVIPDASTLAVEVTATELKTHEWRLPRARKYRVDQIRADRNDKLVELDIEYQLADEGVHPDSLNKSQVAAKKVALRDLPPKATTELAKLNNTDDIAAYTPDEIK